MFDQVIRLEEPTKYICSGCAKTEITNHAPKSWTQYCAITRRMESMLLPLGNNLPKIEYSGE